LAQASAPSGRPSAVCPPDFSMIARCSACLAPARATPRGSVQGFRPDAAMRHYASSRINREATLAKVYLQGYIKATREGNVQDAMHYLEKANAAAGYVHVRLPPHPNSSTTVLVPLTAIIPTFSSDQTSPGWVLPLTVDPRNEEEMPILDVVSQDHCPKQFILH